jgi:lipopolysaccharide export system permease protein
MWLPVMSLLPIGLFFLRQARNDARLFDFDVYKGLFDRILGKIRKKPKIAV